VHNLTLADEVDGGASRRQAEAPYAKTVQTLTIGVIPDFDMLAPSIKPHGLSASTSSVLGLKVLLTKNLLVQIKPMRRTDCCNVTIETAF
jgi:hypothetical protein